MAIVSQTERHWKVALVIVGTCPVKIELRRVLETPPTQRQTRALVTKKTTLRLAA